MPVRDHQGLTISTFNGLWNREDSDTVPVDHFSDGNNYDFLGTSSIVTRNGITPLQVAPSSIFLQNVKRVYPYATQNASTLIVLTYDGTTGRIYHIVKPGLIYGPILSIVGMTDFAFVPYAGRGYISPFASARPVLSPPSTAPTGVAHDGLGLDHGLFEYGVSFVNATGETTVSPLVTVQTFDVITPPSQPLVSDAGVAAGGSALVVGANYQWKFSLSKSGSGFPESDSGIASAVFVAPSNTHVINAVLTTGAPGNWYLNIYRTLANGAIYYWEWTSLVSDIAGFHAGQIDDATILAGGRLAPTVDGGTEQEIVFLDQIPTISPNGGAVLSRNLWRTMTDGLQLKFLANLAGDITTQFTDIAPDVLLGANAPTVNTAFVGDDPIDIGMDGEVVYVYAGDGTNARPAAGAGMAGTMTVSNGAAGHTDPGLHIFGFVTQSISGYNSPPTVLTAFTTSAGNSINFSNIPVSGDSTVIKRLLVATKVIDPLIYNGNLDGYQFFFVPNGIINDNITTSLSNISFYDADLLSDASGLLANYTRIPAGAVLNMYHNRLVVAATATDISLALISQVGQPEAISQVTGLIVVPLNGDPISNAQELRDVLYFFKQTRTSAYADNGLEPSFWGPEIVIDKALGTFVHGVAATLDVGGVTIDQLIICTYQGISLFNGRYIVAELSWKIAGFWKALDRTRFDKIQIINESISKRIYCVLPDRRVLVGDYSSGLDWKNIKWTVWSFNTSVVNPGMNAVAEYKIDNIIFGADSGLYKLTAGQTHDELYTGDVKIPNPFVETAFLP